MSTSLFTHYVFVDLENVPKADVSGAAGREVHVTLLIGKQQKSFGLEMLRAAQALGERLELVEVGASGRNALDLTLSYYLGRAVVLAPNASFAIVSRDKDFDPMIAHLRAKGFQVTRHAGFEALPFLSGTRAPVAPRRTAAPVKAPTIRNRVVPTQATEEPWDKIVAHLHNPDVPRPMTRARLLGFLKNRLGKDGNDGEALALLDRLQVEKRLSITKQGKVTYF